MVRSFSVAVVGATGAVGNEMISLLQERNFPVGTLRLLASERSVGKKIKFKDENIPVDVLKEDSFKGIDYALFSAGASRSKEFCPIAADSGAVVIDNSSAFRMEADVPLVVPEVNPHAAFKNKGIIANPNCSTIQMVVALKPLHDYAGIKRVVVSTYQSVSGAGKKAMEELAEQSKNILNMKEIKIEKFPHQIAFNCIPQIDSFLDNGYTKEEIKMVNETKKIMEDDSIAVTATTVRVPVFLSHSEAVNIEFKKSISAEKAKELLKNFSGVVLIDDVENSEYPLAISAAGKNEVFVGRIRKDVTVKNGLDMWVVADNLRKGAATNAVQIAELLIKN